MIKVHAEDPWWEVGVSAHWEEGRKDYSSWGTFPFLICTLLRRGSQGDRGFWRTAKPWLHLLSTHTPPQPFPCMPSSRGPSQTLHWDVPSTAPREMSLDGFKPSIWNAGSGQVSSPRNLGTSKAISEWKFSFISPTWWLALQLGRTAILDRAEVRGRWLPPSRRLSLLIHNFTFDSTYPLTLAVTHSLSKNGDAFLKQWHSFKYSEICLKTQGKKNQKTSLSDHVQTEASLTCFCL